MPKVIAAMLLALPVAAGAAEYLEKTPFQLSRAFSPGVVTEGGKIVWVAGQTATRDNAGNDIANNFEAQAKQVFSQIDQVLKRAALRRPLRRDAQGLLPERQLSGERAHHGDQLRAAGHRDRDPGDRRDR